MEPVSMSFEEWCDLINNEITPLEARCSYLKDYIDEGRDLMKSIEELGFTYEEAKEGMKKYHGIDI